MAAVGLKRNSTCLEFERVVEMYNLLDKRFNNFDLSQIQMNQVCVNLVGLINDFKGTATSNTALAESNKLVFVFLFTKQRLVTNLHVYNLTLLFSLILRFLTMLSSMNYSLNLGVISKNSLSWEVCLHSALTP